MKEGKHTRKSFKIIEVYSVLILIATLFMSIGYAEITGAQMTIEGTVEAEAQDGVFITDVTYLSNNVADITNSKVNYYLGTVLDSEVKLGNESNSSITYQITIYNSTNTEQLFIETLTDSSIPNSFTNENIEFYLEGIENGITTISPKDSLNFLITFRYKKNVDTTNGLLKSILNFRFLEKPILILSNEGETYALNDIYPDYTPQEYQFTVSNYGERGINNVPMTYYFETRIDKPLSVKIYDENGKEIKNSISIAGDGSTQLNHKYTLKIIWDNSNPVKDIDFNSPEYENKQFNCMINLKATPSGENSEKYSQYILTKQFDIDIKTAKFYFEASVQQEYVELYDEAEIALTIKNYLSENKYNTFDTNYQITLENNDKFEIAVEDANSGIIASGTTEKQVTVKLTPLENVSRNAREDIVLKITSTEPYSKEISIEIKVFMFGGYVQYDNKSWIILYNDDVHGLQMITANVLEPGNVCLGYKDTTIENAVNETVQKKDLNGDGVIENITLDNTRTTVNSAEKAAYSYNKLIETLNKKCEELVTDKSKIAINEEGEYIIRSVGTNPIDKDSENKTLYTSNLLASWPLASANTGYNTGAINGKLKGADTNWESDLDRMGTLNLKIGYDSTGAVSEYWFATRYILTNDANTNVAFGGRFMNTSGALTRRRLFSVSSDQVSQGPSTVCYGVRPVITLNPNVQLVGVGTKTSPIVVQ